ncbi:conserved hypothetical protein [Talaromyces stipitatus ATCC 10500]|uniref:Integrase catalytic domain-containing protein n=1 Tax=Talaromyces stipitatus (strain ATCC 10500 / CBS 375.48 / QM 6759 / NRRL 1006) TaxID=441959 RepID=B8MUX1_TALSN|nr:uncharacterized protein TSTA_109180 [Talaromyces stipitatus ATCC 10500]EED11739.1 conserved hypothetical protein [Talaromyces stipitatus ATCC 10500]
MAFMIRRHRFNSWTVRKERKANAKKWHVCFGHPGPQAIKHLATTTKGVRVTGLSEGPTIVQCEAGGRAKARRIIRREERNIVERPGKSSMNGEKILMLITDRFRGFIWDFYMTSHKSMEILETLKLFFKYLKKHHDVSPIKIEMDNKIFLHRPEVKEWLITKHVTIKHSTANNQGQNGAAERSGSVIKDKARAMRNSAKLPEDLWSEIYRASIYLYNRTPKFMYNWKTPYDRFHTCVALQNRICIQDQKPQLAHLKVYGCKAYTLTSGYQLKKNRLQRFNPRAWVGYLVGYDSTNVYRIWNPSTGRIVRARDVIFNEDEVFSGDIQDIKDDLLHVSVEELTILLNKIDIRVQSGEVEDNANFGDEMEDLVFDGNRHSDERTTTGSVTGSGFEDSSQLDSDYPSGPTLTPGEGLLEGIDKYAYPTPPDTPPSALLAASITIIRENDLSLRQSSKHAAGTSTGGVRPRGSLVQEATIKEDPRGALDSVGTTDPEDRVLSLGTGPEGRQIFVTPWQVSERLMAGISLRTDPEGSVQVPARSVRYPAP